jgi:hypothetical protein
VWTDMSRKWLTQPRTAACLSVRAERP